MNLSRDFKEFVRSLNEHEVRYLIVGGHAVAFHGHPRYTKDLDVWVERASENARCVLAALESFGFGGMGVRAEDFLVDDHVIQLGVPPYRVDILTSLPGVEFDDCYHRRIEVTFDDVTAYLIDLAGLRAAKLASGRHQDLADLEQLPRPPG